MRNELGALHDDWAEALQLLATGNIGNAEITKIKTAATKGADFAERISLGLAFQLLYSGRNSATVDNVLFEIEHMEKGKKTSTKPAELFRHPPLHPLWHKHFCTPSHIFTNVGIRWNIDQGKPGNAALDEMIYNVGKLHGHDPKLWPGTLAHFLIIGGLEERIAAGRITGDWIIFGKHKMNNFYLLLAQHKHGKPDQQGHLFQRIKDGSYAEFPFLFGA